MIVAILAGFVVGVLAGFLFSTLFAARMVELVVIHLAKLAMEDKSVKNQGQ